MAVSSGACDLQHLLQGLGYFNLSIYEALGYASHMQFILNLVNSFVQAVSSWAAVSVSGQCCRVFPPHTSSDGSVSVS